MKKETFSVGGAGDSENDDHNSNFTSKVMEEADCVVMNMRKTKKNASLQSSVQRGKIKSQTSTRSGNQPTQNTTTASIECGSIGGMQRQSSRRSISDLENQATDAEEELSKQALQKAKVA